MPTTRVMATALPYSLADDAPRHLSAFVTLKLDPGAADGELSDFPAAADWVGTLQAGSWELLTDATAAPLPLTVVPDPDAPADAGAWAATLPPTTPVAGFPAPKVSDATWNSYPANRLSDRAVDLHMATVAAAPTTPPGVLANPAVSGVLDRMSQVSDTVQLLRRLGRGHPAASDRGGRGEHRHTSGSTGRRVCVERRSAAVADRGAARRRRPRRPRHPSARRRAGQGPQRRPRHRADVRRARQPALLRPARGADAVPAQPDPGSHHAPAGRPQAGLPRPGRVVRVDAGAPRAARTGRRPGTHRPGAAGRARQCNMDRRPVHRGRRRRRDPGRAAAHAGDRPRRPVRRAQLRRVGGRRRTPWKRRLGPPRPRPRRVRAQARPAAARAAPRGRHRGQRRPCELGS